MIGKVLKIAGFALLAVVVLVGAWIAYMYIGKPSPGPVPELVVDRTPERLARGAYLANHVTGCMDCHSQRDTHLFSAPVVPGTEGMGGQKFTKEMMDLPGELIAPNITPAGIGKMSDGELLQAIVSGIGRDKRVLFPLMPYPGFRRLSQEDLYSIIAYIRSLKPIENSVPVGHIDFPVSMFIRSVPEPYTPEPAPDTANHIAYGKYMVTIAGCGDCHTPMDQGKPIVGKEFAGGMVFHFPIGVIRSANITPDEETGIGLWTKDMFIEQFEMRSSKPVSPDSMGFQTIMPWTLLGGMTTQDLGAIYDYLRTIPPVKNEVEKFTAAGKGSLEF